ncbi:hypothetical protein RJ640_016523, partial [Escallonia rubra]
MGKTLEFFPTKLNLFFLLLNMLCNGLGHGLRIDQAGSLRTLRRAKMHGGGGFGDEKWTGMGWDVKTTLNVGKMEDDLIEKGLPGQPPGVVFKQYAGYVDVDESKGRSLFYYLAEAVHNPASKPLILWLNGGPGCSSLGVGAMVEIGPFGVKPDGRTLYSKPFAWNKVANTLFLESPAGVGFSYSNTTSDYKLSGDKMTAQDAYTFLVNWFKRYPHYRTRDFYIMGESYSGFYIPELADMIIKRNMVGDSSTVVNLKGVMIGNGIMNDDTDSRGSADYIWSHALISDETHSGLIEHCTGSGKNDQKCEEFEARVEAEAGNIDFYNIYGPECPGHSNATIKANRLQGHDPCEEDYVYKYLNLPQVQEALHANRTKLPYPWDFCSYLVDDWKDSPSTMFPIYKRLIASGLRILLFSEMLRIFDCALDSGDVDAVVPVTGTRYSIDALNLTVIKPWQHWSDDNKEVAGYQVVYDGLTFTTIRGAFTECYEGMRFNPLEKLKRARQSKTSINYLTEDVRNEYLPVHIGPQDGLREADKITILPGQPNGVNFEQYSGYVTVDPEVGRALFYYFVESQNASSKPLVLWLNGGPGCSSFGSGALMELGPFRVNSDGETLSLNDYAWTNVANVLFLESPAGVGFSYSNKTLDYTTGDQQTAADSYTFLVNWLERFPEYKARDFFITGESYAGHYVPQLARLILHNNKITNQTTINLQGIAIGNAEIDFETEYRGMYDFFWTHALISDELHEGVTSNCNLSSEETITETCETYLDQAYAVQGNIFYYDIYVPLCNSSIASCYSGSGFDPLEKLLKAQRSKRLVNFVKQDVPNEYSPVYVGPQDGLKEADKITVLPGQPNGVNFDQYSGYVTVDPKAGRALFYYFTESQNCSSKPLVLWLNGGPGCSSFGNGAMMELSPFRVKSDGRTLWQNTYAWNTVANVLFLESPAGVGFSYSNTTSDYITGDTKTAADTYTFLVNWLERFPEYKTRDFFISGESYAGHYVPQLAQLIIENNKITNQTIINLQGIAIGNAYVDYETEYTGMYDYFWSHAIISDEIHNGITLNCNFTSDATVSDACEDYESQADVARANIFFYDIYAPLCSSSSNTSPS